MSESATTAQLGATIELDGVLRLRADDPAHEAPPSLRYEALRTYRGAALQPRTKRWRKPRLELHMDDGNVVALDAKSMDGSGLVPMRVIRARWGDARRECSLVPQDEFADPALRVELRVAEVADGARVRVRGVVTDVRSREAAQQGAFRSGARSQPSALSLSHLAFGSDPARALAIALEGQVLEAPSADDSRRWPTLLAFALTLVFLSLAWWGRSSPVWLAHLGASAAGSLAVAGVFIAQRARLLGLQWEFDRRTAASDRDVRLQNPVAMVFVTLVSCTAAISLLVDVPRLSARTNSTSAPMALAGSLILLAGALLSLLWSARIPWLVAARMLSSKIASEAIAGVIEGPIVDPTPVDSELGPAAVVALTEEEIVPGSNPNITTNATVTDDGFFLRCGQGDVAINPGLTRWASTVYLQRLDTTTSTGYVHHSVIVPVGAPAIGWGTVRVVGDKRKVLFESNGESPLLLACAPHEKPREVLRRLQRRIALGVTLVALALVGCAALTASVWRSLPAPAAND